MPSGKAYAAAVGAVGAAALIEHMNRPGAGVPLTEKGGTAEALEAAAHRQLPCGAPRLSDVKTWWGGTVQAKESGAGADWFHEFQIQAASLRAHIGALAPMTNAPKLSALCARQWLEQWLDAWQAAARKNPEAYAVYEVRLPDATVDHLPCEASPTSWRDHGLDREWSGGGWTVPTEIMNLRPTGPMAALKGTCRLTPLGEVWREMLNRYIGAAAATAPAIPMSIQEERPWIGARVTYETMSRFASVMSLAGSSYGDARQEAAAELLSDLHPVNAIKKAGDFALVPLELWFSKVVGPAFAAVGGAVLGAILPYVVIGGAVYLVVRKHRRPA